MKATNQANQPILKSIASIKPASAWRRGVQAYALELVADTEEHLTRENLSEVILNGAQDWRQYSEGGCALIFDCDIAERLCSPSEFRKVRGGGRNPNSRETWLDAQARALHQAAEMIRLATPQAETAAI
jgi:hypothetical protein